LMFSTVGITAIFSWPFAAALAIVLLCHDVVQPEWNLRLVRRLSAAIVGSVLLVSSFLVCPYLSVLKSRSF
jgi:hypothetical protein